MARDPDAVLGATVTSGQARTDLGPDPFKEGSVDRGPGASAMHIASVVRVDYANHKINLRVMTGETTLREEVPIIHPNAGNRHFLGAMPEPGDMCVIGYGPAGAGQPRRPYIVGWIVPGPTLGHDWIPTQPFAPEEFGLSPKALRELRGVAPRVRHKLRTMYPGNVMGSSSQGADFVLNESVLLANRRGNEIVLRDEDQAFVVRSLQQFHAGAGYRAYHGMVQRDANLLPTQMFAAQYDWAAARQVDAEGKIVQEPDLEDPLYAEGSLTPAAPFQRDADGDLISGLAFPTSVDPYDFLTRGLFIDDQGNAVGAAQADAIYGGKRIYRVTPGGSNAASSTTSDAFVEHRVEVAHTSDGTLPVSEQTDGFDADRLPAGNPQDTDPTGGSPNAPFIESVLGTVVGNDPYSVEGQKLYGLPLMPVVFDGTVRSPAVVSGLGMPLGSHAASLFRMTSPTDTVAPTFWSVTKDGRVFGSVTGPGEKYSAELAFSAGLRIGAGSQAGGTSVLIDGDGAVNIRARRGDLGGNIGITLTSDGGAVRIFGGGTAAVGGIEARVAGGSGEGEGGDPSVIIEAGTNMLLKAVKTLTLSATRLDLSNIQELNLDANTGLNFKSGDGISHSSNTAATSTMGKCEAVHSGPKGGNPANGAIRDTKLIANPATGFPGGPADQYLLLFGDRLENLAAGNHFTNVAVGNQFYNVGTGNFVATATGNTLALNPTGVAMVATTGTALVAASGATAITAGGAVTIQAGGAAAFIATAMSFASPSIPHSKPPQVPGGILTDGCIDPLVGLPFKLTGVIGIQTLGVF